MKTAIRSAILGVFCAAVSVLAQTNDIDLRRRSFEPAAGAPPLLNRFSVSYRLGFNLHADFKNLGGYVPVKSPGPDSGGGVDRYYDDGFDRVDISTNAGGLTWYWGYSRTNQLSGDGTVLMSGSSSSAGAASKGVSDDPSQGFELTYRGQIAAADNWRWGIEAAFGYLEFHVHDGRALLADVSRTSDAYALNGVIPPVAPYTGTFGGPGALISDSPGRSFRMIPNGASITGPRSLDASIYSFRLGPYLEIPLAQKLSLNLSGGVVLVDVDGDFRFQETVTILDTGASATTIGAGSRSEWLVGWMVGRHDPHPLV